MASALEIGMRHGEPSNTTPWYMIRLLMGSRFSTQSRLLFTFYKLNHCETIVFCPFNPVLSIWKYVKHCETIRFFCPEVSTFFAFFHHFSPRTTPPWAVPDHPKPQPRCSWLVGVRLGWAAAQRGDVVPILQEDQDVLVRLPAVVTPPEKDRKMMEQ